MKKLNFDSVCQPARRTLTQKMSRGARILSHADLCRIGVIKGKCAKFDLSRIFCDQFDSLMKTLKSLCINEYTGLGLTFDLLNRTKHKNMQTEASKSETRTSKRRTTQGSYALSMSAISKRSGLTGKIARALKEILMETESISFLKLRSITFKANDVCEIADGVFACDTLRSLRLCDVPLGDKGFAKICRALKKTGVVDFQCRKCGLTDRCGPDLHTLIAYHVSVQSEAEWRDSLSTEKSSTPLICLQTLDLRDNDFTYVLVREIFDVMLDLPLKILDFRGNPGISSTVVAELAREKPETTIRTGLSKPVKESKPAKKHYRSKIAQQFLTSTTGSRPTRSSSARGLRRENLRLRNLVNTLENGGEIVEVEPDLAIVGPKARELARHLAELDQMLAQMKKVRPSRGLDVVPKKRKVGSKTKKRAKTPKAKRKTRKPSVRKTAKIQ